MKNTLTEKQLQKYADVLIWGLKKARKKKYKKGDIVEVRFDLGALRLAEILQVKLLRIGLNPYIRMSGTETMVRNFYINANDDQLVWNSPWSKKLAKNLNGGIYLFASENLTYLKDIDSEKIAMAGLSVKPINDILERRGQECEYGWTLCVVPTEALAKGALMSLKVYTNQIIRACYLDKSNPVQEWENMYKTSQCIQKVLNRMPVESYCIKSKNIDMTITLGDNRKWLGTDGANIPSFEIFTSPDWRVTEGVYYADFPSYKSGHYVRGVRLEFVKGLVVKVTAEEGEKFLRSQLDIEGAKGIGEFALTDKRFSKINVFMAETLFDENYGGKYGSMHIALGDSYTDTYAGDLKTMTKSKKKKLGFNDSSLHWDLINTEKKTVTANLYDGSKIVIYKDGKFLI